MRSDAESAVLTELKAHDGEYLEDVLEALRRPSVSKTGEGLQDMADWLTSYLTALGADVRQVPGEVAPIVEGFLPGEGAAKTLLFYDLYDVQPADEPGWTTPPFEPTIRVDEDGRERVVARGAFNSKGPLMGFLGVLRAFARTGTPLPVNIRFLIEGEEEIGSPSLEPYLKEHLEDLRRCDAAFIPYFGTDRSGRTVIRLGFKGLALLELSIAGGAWGGPAERDIHAMHNAWLESPAWELVHALSTLRARDGTLRIDGVDPSAFGPTPDDARLLDLAADAFDADAWLQELGAERFRYDDPRELLEHLMFDATLNIQALSTGWAPGKGDAPTVLPHRAKAYVDLRVVPGMDVRETVDAMREHLDRRGFEHVELSFVTAYDASKVRADEPVTRSLIQACRRHSDDVVVHPLHAGAAPLALFTEVLGIPYAFGGLGYGGSSHAPNEFIALDGLAQFQRSMTSFLFAFADA